MRGIGFSFCDRLRSARGFLDCWLVVVGLFGFRGFLFVEFSFLALFIIFFFKDGTTTGGGVGLDFFADKILFGVDDAGGKDTCFFVADSDVGSLQRKRSVILGVNVGFGGFVNFLFLEGRSFGSVGGSAREEPAR